MAVDDEAPFGAWGDVPDDGDVRPFSRIRVTRKEEDRNNKRHHFVSATYMDGFRDERGRVWAYRADAVATPLHVPPTSIGYENYYYSQKLTDGKQENHRFEDLWNVVETVWAGTMRAVADHRLSTAISFNLLGMTTLMRTRVPAARERNEVLLATKLRAQAKAMEEFGILPPDLERYVGELDTVPVGINPQQTLLAMQDDFVSFGDLCFTLGFEILHNRSDLPFVTSDNPVCIYDPNVPVHARRPYEHEGEVELVFPLDAWTMLRGSTRLAPVNQAVRHRNMSSRQEVRRINRTVAQFGYRLLIASDRSSDDLAKQYADTSPTVNVEVRQATKEIQIVWRNAFGPRPTLSQFIDTPEKAARLEARMSAAREVVDPQASASHGLQSSHGD